MKFGLSLISVFIFSGLLLAQSNTLDNVHLFQTFLQDATISTTPYGEGGLSYSDYDYASMFDIGVQGGYPINPQVEVNASWGFINFSPEFGDGQSGITDLALAGRYLIAADEYKITAGGLITLPIGSKDVGQNRFNFGGFGAIRYPLQNGMVITGVAGLNFLEMSTFEYNVATGETKEKSEHKASLLLSPGVIYPVNEQFHIVGELNFQTKIDWALLSGGVDYTLKMGSKVRGAIGFGLDNGAPDVMIMGSFLHFFK